ncbi:hypothetical protein PoB_005775200 [Plakobranchus ocellatus]|uniref:Uncharacterized protein n=1 Tax=Plakobranchus ocellatus TaxID=259542 RepID=A0AAV4CIS8_9GAST|nr:hypothetical protein PoB_005775200 [Plakobranchus ocellatus]
MNVTICLALLCASFTIDGVLTADIILCQKACSTPQNETSEGTQLLKHLCGCERVFVGISSQGEINCQASLYIKTEKILVKDNDSLSPSSPCILLGHALGWKQHFGSFCFPRQNNITITHTSPNNNESDDGVFSFNTTAYNHAHNHQRQSETACHHTYHDDDYITTSDINL